MISNTFFAAGKKSGGFTLIEMLLVMVIISMFIVMGTRYLQQQAFNKRIERTTLQIQQIQNAALGYYVSNGAWPDDLQALIDAGFLPQGAEISPWDNPYQVKAGPSTTGFPVNNIVPMLYVWVDTKAGATLTYSAATVIAGTLPMAYTTADTDDPPMVVKPCMQGDKHCNVVATINVPGQNLNNASAVNYANVYHNGACVPAPQCPIDPITGQAMTPTIMVVPVSVSGVNDQSDTTQAYPLNSFTAYAVGGSVGSSAPANYTKGGHNGPLVCDTNPGTNRDCYDDKQASNYLSTGKYWRVCLQVVTSKGTVSWGSDSSTNNWGEYATVLAITRCSINNEYKNHTSSFKVWAP